MTKRASIDRLIVACFFHCVICTGCTPNADVNSLNVRSPRHAETPLSP